MWIRRSLIKKFFTFLLAILILTGLLTACGGTITESKLLSAKVTSNYYIFDIYAEVYAQLGTGERPTLWEGALEH